MVLTYQLFLGLVLLVFLTCISPATTTSPNAATTTSHFDPTSLSENATKEPQSQTPKTERYQLYSSGTTSTETPDERKKVEDNSRQDGGRSLDVDGEKDDVPDFHSENNVLSENKYYEKDLSGKTIEYGRMNLELTTPESKMFDLRYKQIQRDVARSLGESDKMITTKLEREDKYFYSKAPDFSESPESEYKLDEIKKITTNESKNKNRIHKDYTVETSKKMEMVRVYNETKIIDEPKNDDNKKDVSQNEVKDEIRTKASDKKRADLDQQSSDQISEVHVEKIKEPVNNNTIDHEIQTNTSLNKEQLDPIVSNDKEIIIVKRGPKTKQKTTTPPVNLEETNAVEVTTKVKIEAHTEDVLKIKPTERKIESDDMKMINIISDNETTTLEQSITMKTPTKVEETTTNSEMTTNNENTETTESLVTTTQEILNEDNATDKLAHTIIEDVTETGTTEAETNTTETQNVETNTTEIQNDETTTVGLFDESGTNFGGLLAEILTNSTEVAPDSTTVTTVKFYDTDEDDDSTTFYEVTTEKTKTNDIKKNETISNIANEVFKVHSSSLAPFTDNNEVKTISPVENTTEAKVLTTTKINENEIIKQNEINVLGHKVTKMSTTEEPIERECYLEPCEDADEEYTDPNSIKKNQDVDDIEETSERVVVHYDAKVTLKPSTTTANVESNNVQEPKTFNLSTPRFRSVEIDLEVTTTPAGLVSDEDEEEAGNGGKIAAIVISTVGAVCLLLLVGLLIVMRKRQKRFNYGQRCRPVSLDAYSMDNVSIHNSTRRKGVLMTSKRSYGNAAFEDPNSPSHPLNFSELVKFANNTEEIYSEFEQIPQVQAKTSELPEGCEVKNRYANVIPLPETRVFLSSTDGDPTSDYINANFVTGAKSERRYYIACQAPLQNTIGDFWRMIWEQESKVILMLTHLYEQGIEKCIDYLPPSEVLDCHRLFGDFQVTLKKREVRDKYIISSLQLKNMVSNSWREITHIWYMEWPHKGVPDEANSLIRFLIEARSYMKINEIKVREANTSFIQGTTPRNPPVIVHCSPGTGRSGTVIACDIAIREFEQSRQVDIPKIVYKIRRDRASSVQTKEQYSFIYKVINLYATKLTGGAFDSF